MAVYFQSKGKPIAIREVLYNNEYLFCFDFEESSKAVPPKDLPKPELITSTAIINTKQFTSLLKVITQKGDTLETANEFFIKGEICELPFTVCPSDIGYVGFEVTYIPRKENNLNTDNKIEVTLIRDESTRNAPKSAHHLLQRNTEVAEEVVDLHKKFSGVCQKCGQRCDKKVMKIVDQEDNKTIVCVDCFYNVPRLPINVDEDLLIQFVNETNMDKESAKEFLINFPKKYAMTNVYSAFKTYWSWDQHIINKLSVLNDGFINKVFLTDGKELSSNHRININLRKSKPKKEYILVKEQKYQKISEKKLFTLEIKIPAGFSRRTPNPEKVQQKIDYYKEHGEFDAPVVIIQNKKDLFLIDGYTRYLAAEKLNVKEIDVVLVKKLFKGVKKDAIKN